MKNYKEMFSWNKGTVVGLCDDGLVIFDGFSSDGDIHLVTIGAVSDEYAENCCKDKAEYEYLWKELVSDGRCKQSFDDWFESFVEECKEHCLDEGYPGKDDSECWPLFDDEELRKRVEDDFEKQVGWRPYTWETIGSGGCEYITSFYAEYAPEIAKEIKKRALEIEREKAQKKSQEDCRIRSEYDNAILIASAIAEEDADAAKKIFDDFIKNPNILRYAVISKDTLAMCKKFLDAIPECVDAHNRRFLMRLFTIYIGVVNDPEYEVIRTLCNF